MSVKDDFYRLLPEGVKRADIEAQLDKVIKPQVSIDFYGPDEDLVYLANGPTHISVTLPPNIKIPEGAEAVKSKHASADLDVPTIVLVHGLCASSELFDPLIMRAGLRERFRVVMYDTEGHGRSPLSPETGDIDVHKLAETLSQVVNWIGARKIVLVGHSVGGYIATSFAIAHPNRVLKLSISIAPSTSLARVYADSLLVLISPANPTSRKDATGSHWATVLSLTLAQGVGPWLEYTQAHAFHPSTWTRTHWVAPWIKSIGRLTTTQTLARYIIALYGPTPDLAALRIGQKGGVDAMLFSGEYETGWPKGVLPEEAVIVYRGAFGERQGLIPKAGHYGLVENYEFVTEELCKFLKT